MMNLEIESWFILLQPNLVNNCINKKIISWRLLKWHKKSSSLNAKYYYYECSEAGIMKIYLNNS